MLKINLTEGTKYDKKAWTRLIDSGLFEESEAIEIIKDLFEHQISAFRGRGHSWLDKYIDGIARMLLDKANGDADVVRTLAKDSKVIELFNDYLTWVKNTRPKIENQKDREKFDAEFVDTMSLDDLEKKYKDIKAELDAQSKAELANMENDSSSSKYELIPIESYKQMHDMYGGHWTGDGSSDAYAGGGGTAWCHTNNEGVYDGYTKNGKDKFFVLQRKDWKDVPFNAETNRETRGKDEYGNSLVAILTDRFGNLLKNTLRANHVGDPVSADNQYDTWAELSKIAGFNLEKEVAKYCDKMPEGFETFAFGGEDFSYIRGLANGVGRDTITELTIPEGVTGVHGDAFIAMDFLETVTLPSTLKYVPKFTNCSNLHTVKFSNILDAQQCVEVKPQAFAGCMNLTSIELPSSIEGIAYGAFFECANLKKISLPRNLESIEDRAFSASGLEEITLPPLLEYLGSNVFSDCSLLKRVTFTPIHSNSWFCGTGVFSNCTALEKVTLPKTLKKIPAYTFSHCEKLKDIEIPESVTDIDYNAFAHCKSLTDVGDIDISKLSVDSEAFVFTGMSEPYDNNYAIINGTITSVWDAEKLITSERVLVIPEGVTAIGSRAFESTDDYTSIKFPKGLTSIGKSAFGMTDIVNLEIPDSVNFIGKGAFRECYDLKTVKLPNNPEYYIIMEEVFSGDSSLESVVIPDAITWISYNAFWNCKSLTKVTLPKNISHIGDYAFQNCSLRTLTIPNSIQYLGYEAFSNNKNLMAVQLPLRLKWKDIKFAFAETPFYQMKEIEAKAYGESYKRQQMTERLSLGYNEDRSVSEDMELNLEARSWGRSRSNHQYKDLEATRGTTCTLADIQRYVDEYEAEDITNYTDSELKAFKDLHKRLEVIGKSRNGYGYNGALLKDKDSGELFAITKRGSNLSALVRL